MRWHRALILARLELAGSLNIFDAMREQIEKLLRARPFQALAVDVSEDVAYSIPTGDHVFLGKKVLGIEDDESGIDLIPYEHIRRVRYRPIVA